MVKIEPTLVGSRSIIMEQKLFTLLTKHVNITQWIGEVYESPVDCCFPKRYLTELLTALDIFVAPNVNKKASAGYGGGISYHYKPNSELYNEIQALIPSPSGYDGMYLTDADCYEIEQLFDGGVQLSRVHYEGSPQSKGYGFRIEYTFQTMKDVSKEAAAMLQYVKKVLQNGELKKVLEEKQEIEETRERKRLAKEREEHERQRCEEAERIQKLMEEKKPKYLEAVKRAEAIVVPKRKKEALSVKYEDFDAFMYAIRHYTLEEYPQDEAHALSSFFHGHEWVKFWMPNDILHCMDKDNHEYTIRKSYACIAIRPKK